MKKASKLTQYVQPPLPYFQPKSDWVAPNLSELPSWKGVKRLGYDIETKDVQLKELGIGCYRGGEIVGISFAIEDGPAHYLPIGHEGGGNLDREQVLRYIRDNAAEFEGELVTANGSYDEAYSRKKGIFFPKRKFLRDVSIAEPLIYELHESFGLESICHRWNEEGKDEILLRQAAEAFGVDPKGELYKLHAKYVGPYGARDAKVVLPVLRKQEAEIEKQNLWQIYNLESKVTPVLVKMRERGVTIDFDQLERVVRWAIAEQQKELDSIHHTTGIRIGMGDMMKTEVVGAALTQIGVKLGRTKDGQLNIDGEVLDNIDHPVADSIKRARKLYKLRTTFAESVKRYAVNGRVHCTFNQMISYDERTGRSEGAAYGRLSCIRKGTLVEVVRDNSTYPKGMPIEDVKVGDLAYCYLDGKLTLRPVTNVIHNGRRQIIRLHWRGTGRHHSGYLDLTSDHKVLLTSGIWVRADELKEGDRTFSLSRGVGSWGYSRLYPTGASEIPREHRFIYNYVHGHLAEHVHHLNENKLDNRIENLEGLTAAEHLSHHAQTASDELKAKKLEGLKKAQLAPKTYYSGEDHPCSLNLTYDFVSEMLEENNGSITLAARASGHDFTTFKKYVKLYNFDIEELKKQYIPNRCRFGEQHAGYLSLSKEYLLDIVEAAGWSIEKAALNNGHTYNTLKKYLIQHGVDIKSISEKGKEYRKRLKNNHEIMSIEVLNVEDDVYDLTVEETHNFIANEICVHNCTHFNIQQQPSRDEFAAMWRAIYVPEDGHLWGCLDYSGQEPRLVTHFAAAMNLPKARQTVAAYLENPRLDTHQFMADLTGLQRKYAKNIYLGICYNQGGAKLAKTLGFPTRWALRYQDGRQIEYFNEKYEAMAARAKSRREGFIWEAAGPEAQAILDAFDAKAPFIRMLSKKAEKKAKECGFVRTLGGRLLHFPQREDGSFDFAQKSLNRIIQGSAGDQTKTALVLIDEQMPEFFMQMQVHDEIDGSFVSEQQCQDVKELMVNAIKLVVPTIVDIEIGPNWGDIKELKVA